MSRVTDLLEDYAFWDDAVRKKRGELDRLHERKTSIKIVYSDAPGGELQTMADYVAERDELEMDLEELKDKRFRTFSEIMRLAFRLESQKQFDMIYRRDIHRDGWRRICKDLDIKRSTATDLHSRAIHSLEAIDEKT